MPGSNGTAGAAGVAGLTIPGMDGDPGEDGFTIPGPPGLAGASGTSGVAGMMGMAGFDGEEGPEGMPIPFTPGPQVAGGSITVTTESGSTYTAAITDAQGYIRFTNSGGCTFTIPPQSSVAWAANTSIGIEQSAAGAVTIVGGAGVTINHLSALYAVTAGLYAVAQLIRTSADNWTLFGALEAV